MKLTEDKPFQLKQVKGTIVDTKNQISWNFTEKNIIRIEVESGNRKLFYEVNDEFNQNKKLRELIENEGQLQSIINECQDTDGYISVKHLKEKLLEESKK